MDYRFQPAPAPQHCSLKGVSYFPILEYGSIYLFMALEYQERM